MQVSFNSLHRNYDVCGPDCLARLIHSQAAPIAPKIVCFFAQMTAKPIIEASVRDYLNWKTDKAEGCEIFGYVVDNSHQRQIPERYDHGFQDQTRLLILETYPCR